MLSRFQRSSRSAFTLVEILFVLTIMALVSAGLAAFTIDATRGMLWAMSRSWINADMRSFSARISNEVLDANAAYIYPSFSAVDRGSVDDRVSGSQSGDCMVLVETDAYSEVAGLVTSGGEGDRYYTGIVVYYRRPDADGFSPVYRVAREFVTPVRIDPAGIDDHFEVFLRTQFPSATPSDEETVLEATRGLAGDSMFRTSELDRFIVIDAEIFHGKVVDNREQTRAVTSTYNLTVAPKG